MSLESLKGAEELILFVIIIFFCESYHVDYLVRLCAMGIEGRMAELMTYKGFQRCTARSNKMTASSGSLSLQRMRLKASFRKCEL